ncbi:MAG: Type secretion system pilin [Candidatus Parcubacteria bacterium]|jgi:hypothetical protein
MKKNTFLKQVSSLTAVVFVSTLFFVTGTQSVRAINCADAAPNEACTTATEVTPAAVTGNPPSQTQTSGVTGGAPSGDLKTTGAVQPTSNTMSFTGLKNPLKADSVQGILLTVVDLAMNIGIILAIIMIIYAGFRFVWARGNEKELAEAKTLFFYVIIGLAVLISAKVMVNIVQNTLISAKVVDPTIFK